MKANKIKSMCWINYLISTSSLLVQMIRVVSTPTKDGKLLQCSGVFIHLVGERHSESDLSWPIARHIDSGQGLNLDCLI